jgi:hypothetical protein
VPASDGATPATTGAWEPYERAAPEPSTTSRPEYRDDYADHHTDDGRESDD